MIYLVFVLSVLTRFIHTAHLPEFTPIFGALLFSGARLKHRDAIWFPVLVLAVSNWILTTQVFHMKLGCGYVATLLGFAAMAYSGGFLRPRVTVVRFAGCSIGGATAYFLISNFGVWLGPGLYLHTANGLIDCYLAGLPNYLNCLLSTFFIAAVLFAGYELFSRRSHGKHLEPEAAPAN